MKTKKNAVTKIVVLLFLLFCITLSVQAQPGIEFGDAVSITAEVYGIEKIDRTLWLIGPEGNILEIDVSDDAKNFNQLEIGDMVNIIYYKSVAIYLGYPGELPEEETGEMIVRAPKGESPGGVAVEIKDVSAEIKDIDKKYRLITLKGPQGNFTSIYIDDSSDALDTFKVGDVIHARYTKALAVTVELQE